MGSQDRPRNAYQRPQYPHVLTGHTGIHFFLDISPTERDETRQWTRQTIATTPPGTVLIWDPMYGYYNSDLNRSITAPAIDAAGWVLDLDATKYVAGLPPDHVPSDASWSVWLSPHAGDGRSTEVTTSVDGFARKALREP